MESKGTYFVPNRNFGLAQMGKSRLLDKIYPYGTILGTRTLPKMFCHVNGASETLPDNFKNF